MSFGGMFQDIQQDARRRVFQRFHMTKEMALNNA